ncbi:MAG: hypothetical protein IJZ53_13770 [Tyzzerella sp.]|nr:hypothetical protein [Tyzzerella sp.]
MLYSILKDENRYYLNMHAECALHTYLNGFIEDERIKNTSRQKQGIYCRKINADIFEHIYSYPYENKSICIDFKKIEEITENNLVAFVTFIKKQFCAKGKNVYLLNVQKNILEKMNWGDKFQILEETDCIVSGRIGRGKATPQYDQLICEAEEAFREEFGRVVSECTDELNNTNEQHTSVPVYLSKYIDIKKMAESNAGFFRLCIYYLALQMMDKNIIKQECNQNKDISLFFHTMNGGYIAAQLAQLFNVDMVYLDHLGPLGSVHRKHFEKSIADDKNYIIVSDVICLGGEVGRARTIIEYCGGRVGGETCVVDIKTVQNREVDNRASLYTVSKTNNKIDYKIKTDLCAGCEMEGKCNE